MKIVFVTQFYSEGMGYTENMLPKYLSGLGHEVIVVSSDLQIYGNLPIYASSYKTFLGDARCGIGEKMQDGFLLHRLQHYSIGGYIGLIGLEKTLREYSPDVIQFSQAAGLDTFSTLFRPRKLTCPVFTECHQHASIAKKHLKSVNIIQLIKKIGYQISRTLPAWLAHKRVEKCFAIAPDCLEVAHTLYGVPINKLILLPLGTDTEVFHPCECDSEKIKRHELRESFEVNDDEILIIYTGRFTENKNPLILANTVNKLRQQNKPFKALFVGSGEQENEIANITGCKVINFLHQADLSDIYRAADVAVWPREESMSMLDAAASGLPLIVSSKMGEQERVVGNGLTYNEKDIDSLTLALLNMSDQKFRIELGNVGRNKMLASFSWRKHALAREKYYTYAISSKDDVH
jgi:glycosyltransferase involved in cell wall biosynthesis